MEDRDILGQIKPRHPRPTMSYKWGYIVLIIFGAIMIYFIGDLIFGDHRTTFLFSDGHTVESRGEFNEKGKRIGKHTYYYMDGGKNYEMTFDDEGELHGEYLNWNYNGQLTSSKNYVHGLRSGEIKQWDDSGVLIKHEIYSNDTLVKKIK